MDDVKSESFIDRIPFISRRLDAHTREVVEGAAVSFALRIAGAAAQFGFNVLLARMLGAEGMGVYALAFMAGTFTSIVGRAGLDQAALRFMSAGDDGRRGLMGRALWITLAASSVAALCMFAAAPALSEGFFGHPALAAPMRLMALSVVPVSLMNVLSSALRAAGRIAYSALVQMALAPALSLIIMPVLVWSGYGIAGAVLAYVLSTVAVLVVAASLWRSVRVETEKSGAPAHVSTKELMDAASSLLWAALMIQVIVIADTVIVGMFMSPSGVGAYSAAMRMVMLTSFIFVAVSNISAPKFAALYATGEMESLVRVARHSTRITILFAAPLLLLFIFAPGRMMRIFGEGFADGALPLAVISVGQMVCLFGGQAVQILGMTGRHAELRKIMTVSAALNVGLSLMLVPGLGLLGAALSSVAAYIVSTGASVYAVRRHFKFIVHPF